MVTSSASGCAPLTSVPRVGPAAKAVRFVVRRDHPMPRAALEAVVGELAHYQGPPDRPEVVRLPTRRVVPIDAAFLADPRPLAPGSDLLVPAVLLDLYPKSLGGTPEIMVQ